MKRSQVSLVLLSLLARVTLGRIPFICKIRKVDCNLRPDSKCCQYTSTTTAATTATAAATTTTVITATIDVIEHGIPEDISKKDTIQAEPSEIDEVVVKINGEAVEFHLLDTTTAKPETFAPTFCLKLKFNCKLQARHPCCQHPLPPIEVVRAPLEDDGHKKRHIVRQPRKQNGPLSTTIQSNNVREYPLERQSTNHPSNHQYENFNGVLYDLKEKPKRENTKVQIVKKPKISSSNPINKGSTKNLLFQLKKRTRFGGRNKSPVCRIINCKRNKNHKCCQEEVKTTTEKKETAKEIATTFHEETTEEVTTNRKIVTVQEATTNEEETTAENCWSENSINEAFTTETVTTSTVPAEMETKFSENYENDDKDIFDEMFVVSQKESLSSVETRIVQGTGKRGKNLGFDENNLKTLEETEQEKQMTSLTIETTTDMQEQFVEYFQSESGAEEEDNEDNLINVYPVYVPEASKPQLESEVDDSPTKAVLTELHSEHSPIPQSNWLPSVYQPEYLEHSPVFYITQDGQAVEEDEDISDEDIEEDETAAHYCSTLDCFIQPGHVCCSPHVASKRQIASLGDNHIDSDGHDRVTSTVTRVVKSVSW